MKTSSVKQLNSTHYHDVLLQATLLTRSAYNRSLINLVIPISSTCIHLTLTYMEPRKHDILKTCVRK